MPFLKKDLSGQYTWASDPSLSLYTGSPSRRSFNRDSGDQMLFIINALASSQQSFSLEDVKRIEDKINLELPMEVASEVSVFNWLKAQDN